MTTVPDSILCCYTLNVLFVLTQNLTHHHLAEIKQILLEVSPASPVAFARSHRGLEISNAKEKQDVLPSRQYPVPLWQRAEKNKGKGNPGLWEMPAFTFVFPLSP